MTDDRHPHECQFQSCQRDDPDHVHWRREVVLPWLQSPQFQQRATAWMFGGLGAGGVVTIVAARTGALDVLANSPPATIGGIILLVVSVLFFTFRLVRRARNEDQSAELRGFRNDRTARELHAGVKPARTLRIPQEEEQ